MKKANGQSKEIGTAFSKKNDSSSKNFKDDIIPAAFNSALSYNKRNAIIGEFPDSSIDFSLVRLAHGTLYLPEEFSMYKDDEGLHFTRIELVEIMD